MMEKLREQLRHTSAALIDMDGVLYDSMKYHTLAWQHIMAEMGILCSRDEFYLYEGMTGAATIRLIWERAYRRTPSPEFIKALYARKSQYFVHNGKKEPLPHADRMLAALRSRDIRRVLVTGSSQQSILNAIAHDYPGAFLDGDRVTAADVIHGKPHPEPYLRGLGIAKVAPEDAIVVENAPLGVRAGKAAGIFTVAVTTGPIPRENFVEENADIIFSSMQEFADTFECIFKSFA